ncbi:hypothetical protein JJD41_07835 [Oxynema sp. CENA135]|uniref:Uncharacterized protein n=1 Tax=Oxynema aestuarii AP17 TaxID=2064643 RepID=A0A6H1TYA5_9CYAN|nr:MULTISPECIES: hypothetical protein [Oxynema]MBK4729778.1 hypothetical protein [Oxynema sp. CENA135]QIZ71385.1 hypothetical protein HCG48_12980 [Oxynema aestuarii AP17]RMH77425.1 MAG: hypothetical protein D6680_05070 [Cyanobacteria bacterium J007]
MARYTGLFIVAVSPDLLRQSLIEILQECHLDVIYDTGDYIMAREIPGEVPFGKLVTVEVLIDRPMDTPDEVRMNFVMKNEELPLQLDNHCRQMFDSLSEAIAESNEWQLLETAAG